MQKKETLLIYLLLVTVEYAAAQLPSNRPMASFYSSKTTAELNEKNTSGLGNLPSPAVLPSRRSMNSLTLPTRKRNIAQAFHPNNGLSNDQKIPQLPSKKITIHKPKKRAGRLK